MRTPSLLLAVCLLSAACHSEDTPRPVYEGFVTAVTAGGIAVNGADLRFTSESFSGYESKGQRFVYRGVHPLNVYVGQHAKVFGKLDRHTSTVTVDSLLLTAPAATQVSGFGIIDLLPSPASQAPGTTVVRADGRLLTITSKTALTFAPPLVAGTPLHTNQWIHYHAEQQPDGAVLVSDAEIRENVISDSEDKLRQKQEYDPAAVDPESHQSVTSRMLRGVDIKQIPPWPDDAMQARVKRIGTLLIPRYQQELPDTDPTKIHFRFVVVDRGHEHESLALPNGIIVVPYQTLNRLENDAQVATVLAEEIATAIEKQELRNRPASHKLTAAGYAGAAGSLLVPGLGAATGIGTYSIAKHLQTLEEQQADRVALTYLHDAGFDLTEAPKTWWQLAGKPSKPLAQVPLPPRAEYLFLELGTAWRSVVSPTFHLDAPLVPTQ